MSRDFHRFVVCVLALTGLGEPLWATRSEARRRSLSFSTQALSIPLGSANHDIELLPQSTSRLRQWTSDHALVKPRPVSRRAFLTPFSRREDSPKNSAPAPAADPRPVPSWLRSLSDLYTSPEVLEERIRFVLKQNPQWIPDAWAFVDSRIPYKAGEMTVIRTEAPSDLNGSLARTTLQALSHPEIVLAQLKAWTQVDRRTILRLPFMARLGVGVFPGLGERAQSVVTFMSSFDSAFKLLTTEGRLAFSQSIITTLSQVRAVPVPALATWYWPMQAEVIVEELLARAGGRGFLENRMFETLPPADRSAAERLKQESAVMFFGYNPSWVGLFIEHRLDTLTRAGLKTFTHGMARQIVDPLLRGDIADLVDFATREIEKSLLEESMWPEEDLWKQENVSKDQEVSNSSPSESPRDYQPLLSALRRPLQDLVQVLANHLQTRITLPPSGRLTQAA